MMKRCCWLCSLLLIVVPISALNGQQPATSSDSARPGDLLAIPQVAPDQVICFCLYTVHHNTLKLTAQFYPLSHSEVRTAVLEVQRDGAWTTVAEAPIHEQGWTATFRVENWDSRQPAAYRVNYAGTAFYRGTIQRDPVDKNEIVVVAFTGNSINPAHGGDISKSDIVANVLRLNPDLLFFSGDQVYDHNRHYAAWLKFGREFGEVIRDIPTVTIPDDHDVGQPNLWGAGGKKSLVAAGHDGGYFKPVQYVNEVQRAQTSHLPDPFDPAPVQRGISVYYTALTVGGISFAIIEDRKFKSGPEGLVPQQGPRPDHILDPNYDPRSVDVPGAQLLGERQLAFLRHWAQDWHDCEMKAVLSQTIFCGGAHIHGKIGGRLHADLDSNGWPQGGRNRALAEIRKAFALHIAGDQHLGTIFHHGIDDWEDAGYSFCVPSIANLYLRWWAPSEQGQNRRPGMPQYTGRYRDGLGNRVTCWAAANPSEEPSDGGKLTTRAAGFGVVRFDKAKREMTLECWPRNVNITDPDARQYPGWPFSLRQQDNYGRAAAAWLPTIRVKGATNPVVQVVHLPSREVIYTLRILGSTYRPKVFQEGLYSIAITHQTERKVLADIRSGLAADQRTLDVSFQAPSR